ncbi:Ig-like domain-containing protein [Longimicrobium sp.]|uniref:Ig-like domain-containing protein n=1 Tax=Longimicrobium sp. TaxID=2029185 RepID=UPI002D7F70D1|nr:Ig-like domain-containing protein [Longimicrobium sp.]
MRLLSSICAVVSIAAAAACDGGTSSQPPVATTIAAVGSTSLAPALGTATTLGVRVTDAQGRPVPGAAVAWTVSGGGTLSGAAGTTDAGGVAQATLTMGTDLAAPATVDASASPGTVHFTLTGTVPADAVVEPLAGNGATVAAGAAVQLTARVRTAGGAGLAHVPVSFTGSCCAFSAATVLTAADGTASTTWTTTVSGAQTARATTPATADDAAFAVTVAPAAYNHYEMLGPTLTTIPAGQNVTTPFQLKVLDPYGNGVPGVTVTWVARSAAGTVSPTTSVTDANGIASTQWQFNTVAGTQNFGAQVAGLDPTQDFRVVVLAGPIASLVFQQSSLTLTDLSNSTQVQAQAKAFDAFGNLLPPSAPVAWSSTNPAVFTVAETGTVGVSRYYFANLHAAGAGSAKLRIQAQNGTFAEIPVTVTP